MPELKLILDEAEREGILPDRVADRLLPFLIERGVRVDAVVAETGGQAVAFSDTETPSFVRGFHDVLITIGIVVALAGLWGLGSIYAVLPAIIVLAEILVRRQRLALPAVALTFALAIWTCVALAMWTGAVSAMLGASDIFGLGIHNDGLQYTLAFPVVLGLFYLLYRIPLALALAIMGAAVVVPKLILRLFDWLSATPLDMATHEGVQSMLLVACAIGLFAMAMRFDLKDPLRRTVNSDIAFWLHLGAAPVLLYSILWLSGGGRGALVGLETVSMRTPVVVITVMALMLVGLIIDRRAFVTSGLVSLGAALYGIFRQGNAQVDTYVFITLLAVGVIVLVIGTGWMPLRRAVVRRLPDSMQKRLPPA